MSTNATTPTLSARSHSNPDFAGIPEHWEMVGFRGPLPDEFYLRGHQVIQHEADVGVSPQVIIRPQFGYTAEYDIVHDCWHVSQELRPTKRLCIVIDCASVRTEQQTRASAPHWPGFVEIREE